MHAEDVLLNSITLASIFCNEHTKRMVCSLFRRLSDIMGVNMCEIFDTNDKSDIILYYK